MGSSRLVAVVAAADTQQPQQQAAATTAATTTTTTAAAAVKQPRIVGGQLVTDNSKYADAFVHGTNGELCGGSLIHPDVALTAAHCIVAFGGEYLFLGSNHIYGLDDDDASMIPIEFVYPHPQYTRGTEENDILLIKLGQQVQDDISVIPLNDDPSLPVEGQIFRVMGFGRTAENGNISEDLLEVEVDFVPMEICQQQLPGDLVFAESHICAGSGTEGKDSCEGDSGSPLLDAVTGVQFGLVTFGVGCARPNTPGVYTNVQYYLDWIQDFICEHSSIKPDYCRQPGNDGDAVDAEEEPAVTEEETDPSKEPPVNDEGEPSEEPPPSTVDDNNDDPSSSSEEKEPPSAEESMEKPTTEVPLPPPSQPDNNGGYVSVDLSQFRSSARFLHHHHLPTQQLLLLYIGASVFLWFC